MHARAKARTPSKNRAVWNADERRAVQGGKNGIVAQFILNQMNEISDHEGSCRIFVTTYERRKRKISISQKFHNLFVCFLVHYKDRLQAFGCRTEEK